MYPGGMAGQAGILIQQADMLQLQREQTRILLAIYEEIRSQNSKLDQILNMLYEDYLGSDPYIHPDPSPY
jgi:hypothetical protein